MSCGASDGIGSIAPCELGGCSVSSGTRKWMLADKIDAATRFKTASTINPDLSSVPSRDSQGRHAHVLGMLVQGSYQVTLGATNDAVPAYDLLAAWDSIFLQDVSGWFYYNGFDARIIHDDRWFRNYKTANTGGDLPSGIAVNAGAGAVTKDLTFYAQFGSSNADGTPNIRGAIPLSALQRQSTPLRITAGSPKGAAPYAGVTVNGFQGFVRIWLDVVYLDALVISPHWQLESYALDNANGSVRHGDRTHEYLVVRHLPEDTGGQDISDYDNMTLTANNDLQYAGLSLAEMQERMLLPVFYDTLNSNLTDLYAKSGLTQAQSFLMLLPYQRDAEQAPAGVVSYQFQTRPTHTSTRFLTRTFECHDKGRAAKVAIAAQLGKPGSFAGIDHAGRFVAADLRLPMAVLPSSLAAVHASSMVRPVAAGAVRQGMNAGQTLY